MAQRQARQAVFRERVPRDQPTLKQLLAADSEFNEGAFTGLASVTAILNHWKRRTLCRQLDALRAQTVPLAHIWICLFASPMAASARMAALAYNDSRVAVFESDSNLKYYGRFQLALSAPTKHVWLIDDDMVPGSRYLSVMLRAASSGFARRALLGSIGWQLPRPKTPELKLASYRSLVLPVQFDDRSTWGDTDHSLAYDRFTTGGRAKIELRDRIWWHGVQGGGTLHWSNPVARGGIGAGWPLGGGAAIVLIDGEAHARALRPLIAKLLAPSRNLRLALVITGGVRGQCIVVAPLVGVAAAACDERRLRVFDMRLGRDLPALPAHRAATAASAAPAAAASVGVRPIRPVRAHVESLLDLRPIVQTIRASVVMSLADPHSPGAAAAASLSKLDGLTHIALSTASSSLQLGLLGSLPLDILARWHAVQLSVAVVVAPKPSSESLSRLQASIDQAMVAARGTSLGLHLQLGCKPDAVRVVHGWSWPHGPKAVRFRISRAGKGTGAGCTDTRAARAVEGAVERVEAWHPSGVNASDPQYGARVSPASEGLLLLDDEHELSPAALVFLKRALLTLPRVARSRSLGVTEAPELNPAAESTPKDSAR